MLPVVFQGSPSMWGPCGGCGIFLETGPIEHTKWVGGRGVKSLMKLD